MDMMDRSSKAARVAHQTAVDEVSRLKRRVEELQGRLAGSDDACRELAAIKSKHSAEVVAMRREHGESLSRLRREADDERKRLARMLGEVEETLKRRDSEIADLKEGAKWHQSMMTRVNNELLQARGEIDTGRSKISTLQERVELVGADRTRARSEAEKLAGRLARREGEMARMGSEIQALQSAFASARSRSSELEARASELEGQNAISKAQVAEAERRVAEADRQLAILKGRQDAMNVDAFRHGMEECKQRILGEHPEWDLSFLSVDDSEDGESEEEEEGDADVSDAEPGGAPGPSEAVASEGRSHTVTEGAKVLERGEPSRAPADVAEGIPKAGGAPGS